MLKKTTMCQYIAAALYLFFLGNEVGSTCSYETIEDYASAYHLPMLGLYRAAYLHLGTPQEKRRGFYLAKMQNKAGNPRHAHAAEIS